ncbi:MAG: DMT family transporter [Verrucomicrobia bacterium]|nr:DMT family transporter [Verrucomicrobiota bacterium]
MKQTLARSPSHLLGTCAAIFYIFLWASAYVPSKIAATQSSPLWFLAARFLAAGTLLVLLAFVTRRKWPQTLRGWLVAAALGVCANALYLGLTYTALRHLSSGVGAIVASTNPLVLALLAPSLLGEPLTLPKLVGSLLGFAGVLAIVIVRMGTNTALPLDVLTAIGGVLANVASTLIFKRFALREDLLVVTAIQMVAAGLAVIPVAFVFEPTGPPQLHSGVSHELLASFIYLVLVLSVGASLLWFWLLTHGEASRVSAFYYLTPAFGLALSALFLHEAVGLRDLFGLGAIAAGIALVQRS